MAALYSQITHLPANQGGLLIFFGTAAFTTTGTTVTINTQLRKLVAWTFDYSGAVASTDGPITITSPASDALGQIPLASTNQIITVTRPAGTTSGAKFSFVLFGY